MFSQFCRLAVTACLLIASLLAGQCLPALALSLPPEAASHIQQANKAAGNGQYEVALSHYEKIRRGPYWNDRLAKPLASLYYNLAAEAKEAGDLEQSLRYVNEGLVLLPHDNGLRHLKAYLYYNQALEQVELYGDYEKGLAILNEAQKLSPNETAFPKAKASIYLRWAQDAVRHQDLDLALGRAKKALAITPNDESVKQSVSRLYVAMAGKTEDTKEQEAYLKEALLVDDRPELRTQVEQWRQRQTLSGRVKATAQQAVGLGPSPDDIPKHPFLLGKQTQEQLSALEQLQLIEYQLLGRSGDGPLPQRLAMVEEAYFGKPQAGVISQRIQPLYREIITSGLSRSDQTYLDEVLSLTHGQVVRFKQFPLRVYIQRPPQTNASVEPAKWLGYKAEFESEVKAALQTWRRSTLGFVNTVLVDNPEQADIAILWNEHWEDPFSEKRRDDTLDFYDGLRPVKPSRVAKVLKVASAFTPGPYGLIPQAGAAALDYNQLRKVKALQDKNDIFLGTEDVANLPTETARVRVYNTVLIEFGRRLGLIAYDPNSNSLSNGRVDYESRRRPSNEDLATLRALYQRKADIALN